MTALVLLLAFLGTIPAMDPMMLTVAAFETLLGHEAGLFLRAAVLFFGLATVLCWSEYARRAAAYLFPYHTGRGRQMRDVLCLLTYCLVCVVGAVSAPSLVWQLSDLAIGSMTLINVTVLWKNRREILAVSRLEDKAVEARLFCVGKVDKR
jgi:AGCS family alanine or glycine:cation symporter